MLSTLTAISNLNIYHEISHKGSYVDVVVGECKNIKIKVFQKFYNVSVKGNEKCVSRNYAHDHNFVEAIIEMEKLASICL